MAQERQPVTQAELGKEIGLLAHELHNILTVLFGVVEELQNDGTDIAVRNAPLLQAGVEKTEEVAQALFRLRQRTLADQLIDGGAAVAALVDLAPELARVADAFIDAPKLIGDRGFFDRWLLAVATSGRSAGGVVDASGGEPEDARPGTTWRASLTFGSAPTPEAVAVIAAACRSLGGSADADGATVHCDLLRERQFG